MTKKLIVYERVLDTFGEDLKVAVGASGKDTFIEIEKTEEYIIKVSDLPGKIRIEGRGEAERHMILEIAEYIVEKMKTNFKPAF